MAGVTFALRTLKEEVQPYIDSFSSCKCLEINHFRLRDITNASMTERLVSSVLKFVYFSIAGNFLSSNVRAMSSCFFSQFN